jgi:hypothetical protein
LFVAFHSSSTYTPTSPVLTEALGLPAEIENCEAPSPLARIVGQLRPSCRSIGVFW